MIKLFVGLGNPGARYELTRHNAGFWWIDNLACQFKAQWVEDKKYKSAIAKIKMGDETVWLLKPQTFMNLSGAPVAALANFYKIKPEEILVIHDELDVIEGKAKLRLGGTHAGHNGLRDIHAKLGSDQYWRLRLGIGRPASQTAVVDWVLQMPSALEMDKINEAIVRTLKAAPLLLEGQFERATVLVHTDKPVRAHKAPPLRD